ncbi:glutamyl-tRNA synthetase [Trichodelitschia bisporula]|uniref:Glutamyl-tRNA synthetase n=1 Tax=Trichodelitschia bisporula TaxID=703511 RepID=A0A6G1HKY9_9PEZI|nr:glutamyl-tRNA synthetase [Trichodelitschia bisporula]
MPTPYLRALALIDAAHAQDPSVTTENGTPIPSELAYAQSMTRHLEAHTPTASETLRLAVRAQHLRRWEVPRSSYPMTKAGYYAWRTGLARRQAELAMAICREAGYAEEDAERVGVLVRKEGLKSDPECQVLEDVACLVFLEEQFAAFREKWEEEKVVGVVRKTWGKMGSRGRELALGLGMGEEEMRVVRKALGDEGA